MQKTIKIIIVSVCLAISLCACGNNYDLHIEKYDWKLSVVQSASTGDVIYCSEEMKGTYPDVEVLVLECKIGDEVINISDGNYTWEITYRVAEETQDSIIYDIEYAETGNIYIGNAVSGVTEFTDDTYEHTLIIRIGDYSLQFINE